MAQAGSLRDQVILVKFQSVDADGTSRLYEVPHVAQDRGEDTGS